MLITRDAHDGDLLLLGHGRVSDQPREFAEAGPPRLPGLPPVPENIVGPSGIRGRRKMLLQGFISLLEAVSMVGGQPVQGWQHARSGTLSFCC